MSNNYYDEILAQIRQAVREEDYQEAARLLEQELSMPYIPSGTLKELEQLADEVRPHLVREKAATLLKPGEVLDYLTKDTESAFAALDTLRNGNIRNYLEAIQVYLMMEKGDNLLKALLLELCVLQQVTVPLKIVRNGEEREYVPSELQPVMKDEMIPATVGYLKEMLENDNPSFLEQCVQVLVQYAYSIYPDKSPLTARQLSLAIVKYVYNAYGEPEEFEAFCRKQGADPSAVGELII